MPANELFDPIEHAILAHYFGVEPPEHARGIDIFAHTESADDAADDEEEPVADAPVRLRASISNELDETAVENAVARLALGSIQDRLPQWAQICQGAVTLGRDYDRLRNGLVLLAPQLLLEVNWADSGPGFSWPEAWHVTYVPYYHRFVVTSSHDCPDVMGYCDVAMGHFDGDVPVAEGCEPILRRYWEHCAACEVGPWAEVLRAGLLLDDRLEALTAEIWPDPDREDELEVWDEAEEADG